MCAWGSEWVVGWVVWVVGWCRPHMVAYYAAAPFVLVAGPWLVLYVF